MDVNHPTLMDPAFRHWFDNATPSQRAKFREEEEKFWAEIDLTVYGIALGSPHPNVDMEYEPLEKIKVLLGNYRIPD